MRIKRAVSTAAATVALAATLTGVTPTPAAAGMNCTTGNVHTGWSGQHKQEGVYWSNPKLMKKWYSRPLLSSSFSYYGTIPCNP